MASTGFGQKRFGRQTAVVIALFVGAAPVWIPESLEAQGARVSTHIASCRDSRLPPRSKTPVEEGPHLRFEVDVNGDGVVDVLEVTDSLGSGFSGTDVQLTLGGSGVQLKAEEGFAFTAMTAVNPVPKELLDPRHGSALAWIEEALFDRTCAIPDPSLAWLLDSTKRLRWIEGPPEIPGSYAIHLPVRRVAGLIKKAYVSVEKLDPNGEVWLFYGGGVHGFPVRGGQEGPVELTRQGDRVLLGTAHGVILTNPKRSRHAWIYVFEGDELKLRIPSIAGAGLQGDTAIITLARSLPDQEGAPTSPRESKSPRVRINLKTGALAK